MTLVALGFLALMAAPSVAHAGTSDVPVCVDGEIGAWSPSPSDGTVGARTKTGPEECVAYLSTFLLPDTWDGQGFNATSAPQQFFATKQVTVTRDIQFFDATLPDCGPVQVDLHPQAPPKTVEFPAGVPGGVFTGQLFYVNGEHTCQPPPPVKVTATAPKFTEPTCHRGVDVLVPDVDGINYATTGQVKPGGEVTVTASLAEGVKNTELVGRTQWSHVFEQAPTDCNEQPTPPSPPTPPDTPNTQPAPPAPTLPATGGNGIGASLAIALGLIIAGVGMVRRGMTD